MTAEDRLALAAEARERWGDTEAYRRSAERTARSTEDDWARVRAEGEAIEAGFAAGLAAYVRGAIATNADRQER